MLPCKGYGLRLQAHVILAPSLIWSFDSRAKISGPITAVDNWHLLSNASSRCYSCCLSILSSSPFFSLISKVTIHIAFVIIGTTLCLKEPFIFVVCHFLLHLHGELGDFKLFLGYRYRDIVYITSDCSRLLPGFAFAHSICGSAWVGPTDECGSKHCFDWF